MIVNHVGIAERHDFQNAAILQFGNPNNTSTEVIATMMRIAIEGHGSTLRLWAKKWLSEQYGLDVIDIDEVACNAA